MSDPTGALALNDIRLRLQRWVQNAPDFTKKALGKAADYVIGVSRRDFFAKGGGEGGELLHVRSGRLWRSIHKTVEVKGRNITAEIGSNLVYARIHELGGEIRPVRAEYLVFPIRTTSMVKVTRGKFAGQIKAKRGITGWVKTKLVIISARPYLTPALDKARPEIPRIILASLMKNWSKVAQNG